MIDAGHQVRLVLRAQSGDLEAAEELIRRIQSALLGYICRLAGRSNAEERGRHSPLRSRFIIGYLTSCRISTRKVSFYSISLIPAMMQRLPSSDSAVNVELVSMKSDGLSFSPSQNMWSLRGGSNAKQPGAPGCRRIVSQGCDLYQRKMKERLLLGNGRQI
jgi:hypothetical protein